MKLSKYTKESIVRAILADLPKADGNKFRGEIQAGIVKLMSAECQIIYKRTPSALRTRYIGDLVRSDKVYSGDIILGDASEKELDVFLRSYKEAKDVNDKARAQLSRAIMGYTTLNALKKAFPEFEKYLPTEDAPTKNLPALANVVADLSKLGWPKK
jgi:hypothetical protein